MNIFARVIFAVWFLVGALPANAQFTAQATWIATPGGTANAITLPVANWNRNLPGVPITFLPTGDNTTAVTVVVNGVGSPIAVLKPSNTGLVALSGGEIRSGQLTTVAFDGTQFVLQGQLGKFTDSSVIANSALAFGGVVNLQLNATVSANALTIAVKTSAGADPTATTPVLVPFRDVTIASGAPVIVPITAALSFTIGSTNTMGCVSSQMCRLWLTLINNGGTAALCAYNALSGVNIAPINEAALQTSASGTSGGSSAQTYYCSTSAVAAKAVRIVGYIDISEVTAGTWATGPTYVQLFGPGIARAGQVVNTIQNSTTTVGSTTSATFVALTSGHTLPITPQSAANVIKVTAIGTLGETNSGNGFLQLAHNSTLIGNPVNLFAVPTTGSVVGSRSPVAIIVWDTPGTTSAITYGFQGKTDTGTLSYPATSTGSTLILEEIMGAIEPANDNGSLEIRMVG